MTSFSKVCIFTLLLVSILLLGIGVCFASVAFPDVPSSHWASVYIDKLLEKKIISGYANGKFKPDNFVTRAEFSKILTLAVGIESTTTLDNTETVSFKDVASDTWSAQYIESAKTNGIVDGYKDKSFRPDNYITRAEIAKMIVLAKTVVFKETAYLKQSITENATDSVAVDITGNTTETATESATETATENATDTVTEITTETTTGDFIDTGGHWASSYINEAKELKIIDGYADGKFRPDRNATRAEVAKMVFKAFADVLGVRITNPGVPVVTIVSPTDADDYSTTTSSITISGTATDDKGVTEVSWVNNTGVEGTLESTSTWSINDITLKKGLNIITVTASDMDGNMGTDVIRVAYNSDTGSVGGSSGGNSSAKIPRLQIEKELVYYVDTSAVTDGELSVDFNVVNEGLGIAIDSKIDKVTTIDSSGETINSIIKAQPGTIEAKNLKKITIVYYISDEVESFKTILDFSCKDSDGNIYSY